MPVISRFLGIIIAMYWDDHSPPHFHAKYSGYEITVDIYTGVVEGRFPKRALRHVLEWYEIHKEELLEDWELCQKQEAPNQIDPLEYKEMFLHVIDIKYIDAYKIDVAFSNGRKGIVDLEGSFRGSFFEPLKNVEYFAKVTLDHELETVVWPNGADFAPEFLYFKAFGDEPESQAQFEAWGYKAEQAA